MLIGADSGAAPSGSGVPDLGRPAHSEPVFGIVSTALGFVSTDSWTVGFVFSLEKYQGRVQKFLW